MTDLLPNIGLTKLFSARIKNYFLFLQVTNNIEIICQITQYLDIKDILSYLSTSTHLYSFSKVPSIQIRLLKAKIKYYQQPKIQPTFQTFINFLQIKAPTVQTKHKSQKLAKDYECLKKLNQQFHLSKKMKKIGIQQLNSSFEKNQGNIQKQFNKKSSQLKLNNYKTGSIHTKPQTKEITAKNENRIYRKQSKIGYKQMQVNPDFVRFQEIQYKLARQDYERRKSKRIQQRNSQNFMTVEELKKMAIQDPCSRQILQRIQADRIKKQRIANDQRLKMKKVQVEQKEVQKFRIIHEQQREKMVVVKESIVQKLFTNIRSLISKQ